MVADAALAGFPAFEFFDNFYPVVFGYFEPEDDLLYLK